VRYYDCGGYPLCSREVLALPTLHALPEAGEVLFGFHRTPGAGRDTFPVTAPSLLTAEEGVSILVTAEEPEVDPALAAAIAAGRVRAVNLAHPRYEELLSPLRRRERVRVNLLALGDVGSTLLMGLRLLGGDVIDSIGICDVRENVPQRWEMELNQIVSPEGERLPPVEIVSPEEVFDGDVAGQFEEEELTTVYTFFDNNLNISETARQLYVHRNTLVYRLEKIQKKTGLDVRVFEDALTFKIAMMVADHMKYMND